MQYPVAFCNEVPCAINDPLLGVPDRLAALQNWENGQIRTMRAEDAEVNNHIHTIYSFSPYTPSMAALMAREAGLCAAGSVDHDSIAAAQEMIDACAILGIGGCAGFEVRVSFKGGPFAAKKINNPDSEGLGYITVQGIPKQSLEKAARFLAPVREQRLERTMAMTKPANDLLREAKLPEIDFDRDILQRSKYSEGGGITERHLLAAMAEKCIHKFGRGTALLEGLQSKLGMIISPKIAAWLADTENPHYIFDLLGLLKSELLGKIFIQPDENECVPADRVTAFARSISAIPAYSYLGDIKESPTGDKKAEKFEDDFIDVFFAELSHLGYQAITYMPPRNTPEQLGRIRRLAAEWGFMEISGVDINSSRQSFNCPEVLKKEFRHLLDTTWALIAHERLASVDERLGLFSANNPYSSMGLAKRIAAYAVAGKKLYLHHPQESAAVIAADIFKGRLS